MEINYTITNQTLNAIFEFSRLHALLYSKNKSHPWVKRIIQVGEDRAAYAAINIDSDQEVKIYATDVKVEPHQKPYFENYKLLKNNLKTFFKSKESFDIEAIDTLHSRIMGINSLKHKLEYRKGKKDIKKIINNDGVYKHLIIPIRTHADEIPEMMLALSNWLKTEYRIINPIILAAITYYKIAIIHPYDDGNGRLSKIFVHGILYMFGIDIYNSIPIEEYFLRYRQQYYDLIEETQNTNDLTKWVEFFSLGLLYAVKEASRLLLDTSGGTIDVFHNKEIIVTDTEHRIINLLNANPTLSGADIARELDVSRQNVNVILAKMHEKKILSKKGSGSGARYILQHKF